MSSFQTTNSTSSINLNGKPQGETKTAASNSPFRVRRELSAKGRQQHLHHQQSDKDKQGQAMAKEAIAQGTAQIQRLLKELMNTQDVGVAIEATKAVYRQVDEAWETPVYGRDLAYALSDSLRTSGGVDTLLGNCQSDNTDLQMNSAQLLEQVLTADNRDYVVRVGLSSVIKLACSRSDPALVQIGTGILENMFKHSEETCSKVIDMGGLAAILYSCRLTDQITLRHCSAALANCAMYGGHESHRKMTLEHTQDWLFPLAFNRDDSIRYYACLAVALLVANKSIERAVVKSGTLALIEPFVTSHDPLEFAKSDRSHVQGRSAGWLKRLSPLLLCSRNEAQCIAAFHFAMETGIKKEQNREKLFEEIGVIEPLQKLASSSSNVIAARFAAKALKTIGVKIPERLSDNIYDWSIKSVQLWLQCNGFESYSKIFTDHKVDGDLLLTITEKELISDLSMTDGIARRRFLRELRKLKGGAVWSDYSKSLSDWLKELGHEYNQYTYNLMHCGIDMHMLPLVTEKHLEYDAGITNGVHRMRILHAIKMREHSFESPLSPNKLSETSVDGGDGGAVATVPTVRRRKKMPDVFISYRRSTGSQLASLLKVFLQLRGFTVFIDVEKLEAGKFDTNLLSSVKNTRHFILVLSTGALDRCMQDDQMKDWVHREIVTALESKRNIVPVMNNFKWPKPEDLPEDMKCILNFNGVKWIHDYQEACVDKLERFLNSQENMATYDEQTPTDAQTPTNNNVFANATPLPPI